MRPNDSPHRGFGADRLASVAEMEGWHFWFVGRRAHLERELRGRLTPDAGLVLDLGCGTGANLRCLAEQGYRILGLDLLPEGLAATHNALPEARLLQATATALPLSEKSVGAAMLLDVLEHVDDERCLAEVWRVLSPGGLAAITVPALPWLWSYRDQAAGHLRRYTRQRLVRVLTKAGFQPYRVRYFHSFLLPLLVTSRLLGRRGPAWRDLEERPLPATNWVLSSINRLEARLSSHITWPLGSSLLAICSKVEE